MTPRVFALLLCALLAAACGSKPPRAAAPASSKVAVSLVVTSTSETNDGRPMHAVVRAVDRETYAADSYARVADLVTHKDASVLATFVVYPGHEQRLSIEVEKTKPIAVYFLFTQPGKPWKRPFEDPGKKTLRISLARNSIAECSCKR